ncbi:MAG TPA: tetratricopeptide repeat protein [Desulfuromonadaceae bacterium]|nr:tetratricopeptide repeat protein [Desulfuromonadaceae bacterium]
MADKSVNEVGGETRKLFVKGADALARENTDYALALLAQALDQDPAFYDCRKALRDAQQRKAGGSSGGFFKKMLSGAGSSPQVAKAQMTLRSNPGAAMSIAEQILNADPSSSAAHRIIVEASKILELPRTAVMSYEILLRNSPKDKNLAIEFAHTAAEIGESGRAEKVILDLLRENPNDGDLKMALKDMSARRTLDEGGYGALEDGKGSYRDILRNKEEATSLEQEQRVQKSEDVAERLIGEYEGRLHNEPNNLKLIRSLAELYTQKKQFDRALNLYDRLKSSEMGNDPSLDQAISGTIARRFDHDAQQLNPFEADHATKLEQLKADKLNFQVAECQKRVEKFPTDLAIRFEMGQLYFQAGKISEAIQEFQKARNNPNKRIAAMNYLAQCFAKRKMFDMAARSLQEALKEKAVFDDEKKELIYNLGCVLESMGKREEAVEQFKLIYETDIGYKDVAAKVDAFYAGQ